MLREWWLVHFKQPPDGTKTMERKNEKEQQLGKGVPTHPTTETTSSDKDKDTTYKGSYYTSEGGLSGQAAKNEDSTSSVPEKTKTMKKSGEEETPAAAAAKPKPAQKQAQAPELVQEQDKPGGGTATYT